MSAPQDSSTLRNNIIYISIITLLGDTYICHRPLRLQLKSFRNSSKRVLQSPSHSQEHLSTQSSRTGRNKLKTLVHIDFHLLRLRYHLITSPPQSRAFHTALRKLPCESGESSLLHSRAPWQSAKFCYSSVPLPAQASNFYVPSVPSLLPSSYHRASKDHLSS